jgi:Cu/Zn superoxide dismutase
MKRLASALGAVLLTTAVAAAQSYPGDPGSGVQRGIQQLDNSGQVGTVTLLSRGDRTAIVVELHGVPAGRTQAARIFRSRACSPPSTAPAYVLAALHDGVSRSTVNASEDRLLSGNYSVVVFSSTQAGARPTACGWLYAS